VPNPKRELTSAMPILSVDIPLDEIGYHGWTVKMRLNVRARTYDDLLSQEREQFWSAFSTIVLDWNLLDEDGQNLPLPRDGLGPRDLPIDILNTLVLRYIEAMTDSAAIPKARDASSETTSRTNGTAPKSGAD
jgi:hypothetical protein